MFITTHLTFGALLSGNDAMVESSGCNILDLQDRLSTPTWDSGTMPTSGQYQLFRALYGVCNTSSMHTKLCGLDGTTFKELSNCLLLLQIYSILLV